jgi:pyrophosphate--fructose-6-phosphate 1-phosphotransferase
LEDVYRNPGPLQFEGPGADSKPISLCVEDQDYMGRIKKLQEYLEKVVLCPHIFLLQTHRKPQLTTSFAFAMPNSFCYVVQVKSIVKPGCSQDVLKAALSAMSSVTETLNIMTSSSNGQTPL